jgi:hypothetical protein
VGTDEAENVRSPPPAWRLYFLGYGLVLNGLEGTRGVDWSGASYTELQPSVLTFRGNKCAALYSETYFQYAGFNKNYYIQWYRLETLSDFISTHAAP